MSLINFQHDERIVNSINLIRETANVTTIHEPMGAWHIINDMRSHLQEFERNSGEYSYLPGSNKLSLMDKILFRNMYFNFTIYINLQNITHSLL